MNADAADLHELDETVAELQRVVNDLRQRIQGLETRIVTFEQQQSRALKAAAQDWNL